MKKFIIVLAFLISPSLYGECKKADHAHVNKDVVRCKYHQEDIFRCYSKKLYCYPELERRKQCFFCECPIDEHTKIPAPAPVPPARKIRRQGYGDRGR
jgi:hypothetical protein